MTETPRGSEGRVPFTRDRLTWLAYGLTVSFGFGVAAIGPAMPLLRADLGISRAVGGLHFTAIAAGSVVVGFVAERWIAAWGRRRVFWLGGAGVASGAVLVGVGSVPAITLAGSLLMGSAGAAFLVASLAALSDRHAAHRPVALTEANTAMSTGTVLTGLVVGGLVSTGAGWRPAFLVPMVIFVALALLRRSEEFPVATYEPGERGRPDLPPAYWFFWGALIPSVGAEWSLGAWAADYLVEAVGTGEGAASFLVTTFFGAILVGRLAGSRVAGRVRAMPLLTGASVLGLIGFLVFWGAGSTQLAAVGLLLAGLGISMMFPMLLAMAIATAPDMPDVASARVFIAAGGATLVAPFVLGLLADQVGIHAAFAMVPGLFVLIVLLALLGRRATSSRDTAMGSLSS